MVIARDERNLISQCAGDVPSEQGLNRRCMASAASGQSGATIGVALQSADTAATYGHVLEVASFPAADHHTATRRAAV